MGKKEKALDADHGVLSLICEVHVVEKENGPLKAVL